MSQWRVISRAWEIEPLEGLRESIARGAPEWAKSHEERAILSRGAEKLREQGWLLMRSPFAAPGSVWTAKVELRGLESILAMAGKAAAKKMLLELGVRSQGMQARWAQVAIERVIKKSVGAIEEIQIKREHRWESLVEAPSQLRRMGESISRSGPSIWLGGLIEAADFMESPQDLTGELMEALFGKPISQWVASDAKSGRNLEGTLIDAERAIKARAEQAQLEAIPISAPIKKATRAKPL